MKWVNSLEFFRIHRNIQVRIITSAFARIAGTMVMPYLAVYFAARLGAALAGALLTANVVVTLVMGLYGGYLADRLGRKRVMVGAQALIALAFTGMALANSPWLDSVWLTFSLLVLLGAGNGLLNPAAEAMLIDFSTRANRSYMYAINYWVINLSLAAGSILGGLFYQSHRFQLFVAVAVVALLNLSLMTLLVTESRPAKGPVDPNRHVLREFANHYRLVVTDRLFLWFCLGSLLVLALEFQLSNYIGVQLSRSFVTRQLAVPGIPPFELTGVKMIGLLQLINTTGVILLVTAVARFTKRFNHRPVLTAGVVLYVSGYAVLGMSRTLWPTVAAMAVATLGELMQSPLRQAMMADLVREEARSSYVAVNGLVFQGAKIMGSLGVTLGAVVPAWSMSGLYLLSGLTGLAIFRAVSTRGADGDSTTRPAA